MLKISALINEGLMITDLSAAHKEECLAEMIARLKADGRIADEAVFLETVMEREAVGPTGIGMKVAIPHGKSHTVRRPALVFAKSKDGVDFNAPDGSLASLIFLIAVPDTTDDLHLKILAKLARSLMHEEFRSRLLTCEDKRQLFTILEEGVSL
ncbi:MAG TPA: PTS fructose transporter subunit IIA [Lachnoclostridium sp.]|uniref:PTS sugar transporter subunit IIA n=1 Tax=Lacrimispora sp. TaxID=2719234 RepID=UPI000EE8BA3F|nr:fructose PTS transporter subunit IIA [Lacrimispora sp.]HCD44955.1 PTS fructose transporter subunit IIA [Lachnoclostridium sp.]